MNSRILAAVVFVLAASALASSGTPTHGYKVLPPITRGNLSLFPIVGGVEANTAPLLTLDEGLRASAVVVAEAGSVQGLVRPGTYYPRNTGGEVNRIGLKSTVEPRVIYPERQPFGRAASSLF